MAQTRGLNHVRSGGSGRKGGPGEFVLVAFYLLILLGAAMFRPSRTGRSPTGIPEPADEARPVWPDELDRIPVRPGRWQAIVIHHTATDQGDWKTFDDYHRYQRKWANGLGYHFLIYNGSSGTVDGQIYVGDRWKRQLDGAHCLVKGSPIEWNKVAIGIALVGNFTHYTPSRPQFESLVALVKYLRARCAIPPSQVYRHCDLKAGTECPGKMFPWNRLRRAIETVPEQ